jgi:methyl-accepting chemotaxis protein
MLFLRYWQTRFNLFTKLVIGFASILSLALLMAALTLIQIQSLDTSLVQVEQQRTRANVADDIRLNTYSQVLSTLEQLWSQQPITTNQTSLISVTLPSFNQLRASGLSPTLLTNLNGLDSEIQALSTYLNQTLDLEAKGQDIEARVNWVTISLLFQNFNQDITRFWQNQEQALQTASQQATEARSSAFIIIVSCAGLAVVLMVGLSLIIPRALVRQIIKLSAAMKRVADSSNLNVEALEVKGNDEVAKMTHAFNQMLFKLNAALKVLHDTGQTVSSSSNYFDETLHQQLTATEQETSAVSDVVNVAAQLDQATQQIHSQIEEMSEQAQTNLTSVEVLSTAVLTALDRVAKTRDATQTVTNGINRMLTGTSLANLETQELVEQFSTMQRLTENLRGITRGTHLLALNASIESVSAGTYGERFKVVAGSVKDLAIQSQGLVDNMGYFVTQMEAKIRNVTSSISQTDQELAHSQELIRLIEGIGQENVELSGKMSEAIQKISQLVHQTVSQAQAIVKATSEQRYATEKIITILDSMEQVVQNNVQSYHTSLGAVAKLRQEVNQLNSQVGNLTLTIDAA